MEALGGPSLVSVAVGQLLPLREDTGEGEWMLATRNTTGPLVSSLSPFPIYSHFHPFFPCPKFTRVPTETRIRLNGQGRGVGEGKDTLFWNADMGLHSNLEGPEIGDGRAFNF